MSFKFHHLSISLDDVAVIPESVTTFSDDDIDLSVEIGSLKLNVPIISAALDSAFSEKIATSLHSNGSIATLNLCGLISRYYIDHYDKIDVMLRAEPTLETLQRIYNSSPIDLSILDDNLSTLNSRFASSNTKYVVAATPQQAERLFDVALKNNVKNFVLQSSFISPYWSSKNNRGLDVGKFVNSLHQNGSTIMVGNIASLNAAVPFIEAGVDAIIEGVGPGTICTTRTVLGIGAGHIATIDSLRDYIEKQKSKTKIIADGGIHNSGDIVKLLCCGAHCVMLGSIFARTTDAPFVGLTWGMSAFHKVLPRGTLMHFEVDEKTNIDRVLNGPSNRDNGTLALVPAIRNAFSNLGCLNIDSAYSDTVVTRFPGMYSEGKLK